MSTLTLISHHLCPYVQRATISLSEKSVPFERVDIDLSDKPDWFHQISPLGKVPLLRIADGEISHTIFESAVILEYLEETQPGPLHPMDPLLRARHRSWIEFGSSILNRIAAFYNAKSDEDLMREAATLGTMFDKVEAELGDGLWFTGPDFSLVDAAYGPIFRYFDVFDEIDDFAVFDGKPKTEAWRRALSRRPSIQTAVAADYPARLRKFLIGRNSALSERMNVYA